MIFVRIPIFLIYEIFIAIEIQLVHSKKYRKIFGLPLFLIGITVFHATGLHYHSTSGIISVMCCRDVRQAIPFHLLDDRFASFRYDSFMPEFFAQSIPEIVMFFHINFYIANGIIVLFQTDSIIVSLWLCIPIFIRAN